MSKVTRYQKAGVLKLISDLGISREQLQSVQSNGILADVLTANMAVVERDEVRRACGHMPLKAVVEVAANDVPPYRLEPLPLKLSGKKATLKKAMVTVAKEKGSVSLYKLWKSDESLIPEELKTSGEVIFFPEEQFDDGGHRHVRCVYWNGSYWRWFSYWVSDLVSSDYRVPVPASIPKKS